MFLWVHWFVCCAEVFFSLPSNRRSGHVVCWIENWHLYIYMYIFWKGEVMKWKILEDVKHLWSTPSSRKACIYGLTGVDFSSVKSSSWILCIAQQLQVCQPSPSDVWCWRACRGRRDFYICFHFWQFVWNTMIILLRYPMNLHNWLHAISCLKNHWVEVWR